HPLMHIPVAHSVDDAVDVGAGNRFAIARALDPLIEQLSQRLSEPESLAAIPVGTLPRDGNESVEIDATVMGRGAAHFTVSVSENRRDTIRAVRILCVGGGPA